MHSGEIISILDIGTTKVAALIASVEPSSKVTILGVGAALSEGMRRGVVVNIDKTTKSIRQAMDLAEQQAGVKVNSVTVGISGDNIQSFLTRSIIAIPNANREIAQNDVDRIIEDARNFKIPTDRNIIHVIPQDFIIDGQDGVTDPIGMSGVRMEANVHVVTSLYSVMQNLQKCVERAGLSVMNIVLEPIASSHAVLESDEKEVGVALIDIGGGTTDIAVYKDNVLRHTAIIPMAGNEITEDIAIGLGILNNQAERVKREFGHASADSIMHEETIMIPGIGGRSPHEIDKSMLARMIGPRMEEIFELCFEELRKSGYINRLPAGIVLTGGTSLLHGSVDLARRVLGMHSKLGVPSGMEYGAFGREIENPMFATSVGLLIDKCTSERQSSSMQTTSLETNQSQPVQQEHQQIENKQSFIKKFFSFFDDL